MGLLATSKPTTVSTPSCIADIFNRYFISVFSSDDPEVQSHPPSPSLTCLLLLDVQVTEEEILRTLLKLETTKATGPDSIPSRPLKETAVQIAPSLAHLFNMSLSCAEIPDEWKTAIIVPVYKKGNKCHVENYRPISLLSIVSKVLERCVLRTIRDHFLHLIITDLNTVSYQEYHVQRK